jgi:uncharacterized protein (DUF952 family)
MPDISLDEAHDLAERWVASVGALGAGIHELDLGYVVYPCWPRPEPTDDVPPPYAGTARGVIDKAGGELTMWPCVPPETVAGLYRRHRANQGPIYHIALEADWTAARAAGEYAVSTRGATLADEGFIHASFAHQVPLVAAAVYDGVTDPLVVLVVDSRQLMAPIVVERPPDSDVEFPHVYGPIPADAVTDVVPLADFTG